MKSFIKEHIDATPIVDNVFQIATKAKQAIQDFGANQVVDATIGTLCDEQGQLVTFQSVYDHYNTMSNASKAKYAASFIGNEDFRASVYNWVVQDTPIDLKHSVIATPGGSGAISASISSMLDEGQTILLPEIAWGSYALMAQMNNVLVETYTMFDQDCFAISSFKHSCLDLIQRQGKLFVILNDPCHNPTGYSLSDDEWKQVIEVLNECSKLGAVVLLNDIAYIDYAYDFKQSRQYMKHFNDITKDIMIVVAFSMSKSFTSYGMRCGAALLLSKTKEAVRQVEIVLEKSARALWSNVPNGAMDVMVYVTNQNRNAYTKELQSYVTLLEDRSQLFLKQAKEVGLVSYPYKEGFFVTLKMEDKTTLDDYHEQLMKENIYCVKVNKGIRIAICSMGVDKIDGLAIRMKNILDCIK